MGRVRAWCCLVVGAALAALGAAEGEGAEEPLWRAEHAELTRLGQEELQVMRDQLRDALANVRSEAERAQHQSDEVDVKRREIEEDTRRLERGRAIELDEVSSTEMALFEVQEQLSARDERMKEIRARMDLVQAEASALRDKMASLAEENARDQLLDQSHNLTAILDVRARAWGSVSRSLYDKSKHLLPPAQRGLQHAASIQASRSAGWAGWALALCLYAVVLGGVITMLSAVHRFQVFVPRALLALDTAWSSVWLLLAASYTLLLREPLGLLKARSETWFFGGQVLALFAYLTYLALKLLTFGARTRPATLVEFVVSFGAGHHIYRAVWLPMVTDAELRAPLLHYVLYMCLYGCLSYVRLSAMGGFEAVRQAVAAFVAHVDHQLRDLGFAAPLAEPARERRFAARDPGARSRRHLSHYL